jgi:hypothetical protein
MKEKNLYLLVLVYLLISGIILVPPVTATSNWYVNAAATDEALCTYGHPCLSLRSAYDLASSGDVINVASGRYYCGNNISLEISKDISFIGVTSETTIIDACNHDRFLNITTGNVSINHLTIINGSTSESGGGIYQKSGALSIDNSNLSKNSAFYNGGGIASFGYMKISNSTISDNFASHGSGGGLWLGCSMPGGQDASPYRGPAFYGAWGDAYPVVYLVENSNISYNAALSNGGGISQNAWDLNLFNSTIFSNTASSGGGLYIENTAVGIKAWNNIFKNNDNFVYHNSNSPSMNQFVNYQPIYRENIIGGPIIKGNYWSNSLGNGCGTTIPICSVNCADSDGNGLCDEPLDLIDWTTGPGWGQLTTVSNVTPPTPTNQSCSNVSCCCCLSTPSVTGCGELCVTIFGISINLWLVIWTLLATVLVIAIIYYIIKKTQ